MITTRICLLALLGVCLQRSADPFVVPSSSSSSSLFGISVPARNNRHQSPANVPFVARTSTASSPRHGSWRMFAKSDKADDWEDEPNEEDLMSEEFADIAIDDAIVEEIEDDTVLVVASEDEEGQPAGNKNDDDEDLDDDEIDEQLWEDEEEEEDLEIVEEDGYEVEEDGKKASGSKGAAASGDDEWYYEEEEEEIPLQDDPDDPDYMAQKKIVEETIARRDQLAEDNDFDPVDYVMNHMTEEQAEAINNWPLQQEVNKIADEMVVIEDEDVENINLEEAMAKAPDLMDDDPYEDEGDENIIGTGVTDKDMKAVDDAWKSINEMTTTEPWDKISFTADTFDWENVPNKTLEEMDAALDEIDGSAYNCTRWLLYDLNFNVSNLILAAVKHNPEAPVLFQHWFPQLMTYERYQHARDRDFDFNWEDVENADMDELQRYYMGFGYTEIPEKAPMDTGIIGFEDLDEEEIKMAALENWMTEVYNPEWDRKDFDDDTFRDEDNVFSTHYEAKQHPDLPSFEEAQEDLAEWEEDSAEESVAYKEFMGKDFQYTNDQDEEFEKKFKGHVVVACCPLDEDLEIAEKITAKMGAAFGKQLYVETRVVAHAREEDAVFEVWLESFDIDLLHSKKRASSGIDTWTGPAECDDAQIDYLVEEVRFLISEEARYSYRFEYDFAS
jgi:hypothetical protein